MDSLRTYTPQVMAVLQVGLPLHLSVLCFLLTKQGRVTGWWVVLPLVLTFPLLWARGRELPGPAVWSLPLVCWAAAVLTSASRRYTLRAAFLLAAGVGTAGVQVWQLCR